MSEPAIAADFDQPLDVEINILAEFSLDAVLFIDNLTETIYFVFGEFFYLRIRGDFCLSQDLMAP